MDLLKSDVSEQEGDSPPGLLEKQFFLLLQADLELSTHASLFGGWGGQDLEMSSGESSERGFQMGDTGSHPVGSGAFV